MLLFACWGLPDDLPRYLSVNRHGGKNETRKIKIGQEKNKLTFKQQMEAQRAKRLAKRQARLKAREAEHARLQARKAAREKKHQNQ